MEQRLVDELGESFENGTNIHEWGQLGASPTPYARVFARRHESDDQLKLQIHRPGLAHASRGIVSRRMDFRRAASLGASGLVGGLRSIGRPPLQGEDWRDQLRDWLLAAIERGEQVISITEDLTTQHLLSLACLTPSASRCPLPLMLFISATST